MRIIRSVQDMQSSAWRWRQQGKSIGFVPTMGALHEGHASLLRRARKENDVVVASVFVNPLQFGPKEDLARYPRTLAKDERLLAHEKTDALFAPSPREMYPDGFSTVVDVPAMAQTLCGPFRPGHFRGVATVVAKLFELVH